jgi:hypothetical protein
VVIRCRVCGSHLQAHEVECDSALFIRPTATLYDELVTDPSVEPSGPEWLCRYLDGYPCFDWESVDLTVNGLNQLLEDERGRLPKADRACSACGGACYGPLAIECSGVGEPPLAFLKHKYGAPLWGRLCANTAEPNGRQ